jgi:hypothetical protein
VMLARLQPGDLRFLLRLGERVWNGHGVQSLRTNRAS